MRKIKLVLAFAFVGAGAFAQDLTSKKGEPILPESGDWAISFNADPFLEYAGNLFSGSTGTNNPPTSDWLNSTYQTIVAKMFKDEKTAYRVVLRLGMSSNKTVGLVNQAGVTPPAFPNPMPQVEDELKVSSRYIGLGGGLEWRRGKTRLQGYYGGDLLLWMSGTKNTYKYSNPVDATNNPVPSNPALQTNFGPMGPNPSNLGVGTSFPGGRATEYQPGSTLGVTIRGFIGAEYFIFPKISVGAEYGWGISYSSTGQGSMTYDNINAGTVGSVTEETGKSSGFGFDTDINEGGSGTGAGSLKITFHF